MSSPLGDSTHLGLPGNNTSPPQSISNSSNSSIHANDKERWATGLGQFQELQELQEHSKAHTGLQPVSPTAMSAFPRKTSKSHTTSATGPKMENTPLQQSPPGHVPMSFGGTDTHSRHSSNDSDHSRRVKSTGGEQHQYDGVNNRDHHDDSDSDSSLEDDDRVPFAQPRNRFSLPPHYAYLSWSDRIKELTATATKGLLKYFKFVGPGVMVSVAYMDPGNYSTAVSAGATYQYKLLFVVLLSNLFAVFLQTLCVKLGSVTGLNLAQNCREHLPRWLCISIYVLAEIAIIATDLAEVVGTAISLNILFGVPLPLGVMLTVVDVLIVLMAYRPNGEMKIVRYFEYLVSFLVVLVVACFAIELGNIGPVDPGEIFRGFLPSTELLETQGLYLSCGILGATVMPHSLYLGSGLVQSRLRDFDKQHGYFSDNGVSEDDYDMLKYKPSIHAINYSMTYSIVELVISLFTVAIFVNSAILIVAGATLSNSPDAVDADLFSIYEMLQKLLSPAAGTVFALALLFSGQSAGIVCTLSGQMVSEGFLQWSMAPWIRRMITRALAIAPCLFVSVFVGRKGLADVLNASQVVLSVLLPFVSAPLLYFTCKKSIMRVPTTAYVIVDATGNPIPPQPRRDTHNGSSRNALSPTTTLIGGNGGGGGGGGSSTVYSAINANSADNELELEEENFDSQYIRSRTSEDSITSSIVVPEYKDMSNSQLTNITAVVIFGIVTCLNLFMIASMAMGVDVHF